MQYWYANANDSQSGPYPDTRLFVDALRAQTPPELQYYITDAFESIVLYDNRAVTATVTQTPDHKYKVTLTVQSRKLKSDGSGSETPTALSDYIDIGVFTGKKDEEKHSTSRRKRSLKQTRPLRLSWTRCLHVPASILITNSSTEFPMTIPSILLKNEGLPSTCLVRFNEHNAKK